MACGYDCYHICQGLASRMLPRICLESFAWLNNHIPAICILCNKTCMYICTYVPMYACMYACTHVSRYAVCTDVCTVCMYIYILPFHVCLYLTRVKNQRKNPFVAPAPSSSWGLLEMAGSKIDLRVDPSMLYDP